MGLSMKITRIPGNPAKFLKALLAQSVAPMVLTAALTAPCAVYAQQTTSSLSGTVLTAEGKPAAGTAVVIVHGPSGTVSNSEVDPTGRFFATSLRVGGPYTVRFEPKGGQVQTLNNIFLQLGETFTVSVTLKPAAAAAAPEGEEIIVSGRREELKIGAQATFDKSTIADTPTVSRDIKDIIKQDPRVLIDPTNSFSIQIAGTSPRYNSITIDGIGTNDDFGLNNNGYPTRHSLIPLDAIDQLAVVIAPFDVDYDGFQGGAINIVTKSGTNDFHGSGYDFFSGDKFSGQQTGSVHNAIPPFNTKTRGGSLGGPIIEDKLFFFAAYDDYQTASPSFYGTTDGNGGPTKVPGISNADIAQVASIAQSKYGVNIGSVISSTPEHDRSAVGKIDWNITDQHRANFTYIRSDTSQILEGGSSTSSGTLYTSSASSLTGTPRLCLSGCWYNYGQIMNDYSVQEFSDWTPDLSTQLEWGKKTVDSTRTPLNGYGIGNINVVTPTGSEIEFGPDISSQSNVLTTATDTWKGKFKYTLDDHTVSGGYERETNKYYDLFIQRSLGQWYFTSYANFQAGTAARFQYANAYTGNPTDNAALWTYTENSWYVQDRWTFADDLTLQAGLRYERYENPEVPLLNQTFLSRYGFANNANLDGRQLLLPRVGFNWKADADTSLHGGFGQFSTLGPAVWMSNDYNNDGFTQRTFLATSGPFLLNSNLMVPAGVQALLTPNSGFVNALDPHFNIPSSWRFDLALDHDFEDGWQAGADILYTKVADGILYQDLRLVQTGQAPDGRPIYGIRPGDTRAVTAGQDLLLTNTHQGETKNATIYANKNYKSDIGDWLLRIGYSYTDSEDVNPGTSSVASSTYGNLAVSDPNHPGQATSNYESTHVFVGSITWSKAFFDDAKTTLSLLGTARSGLPYSFTFGCGATSAFGDSGCIQGNNRELFYVPQGPNDPKVNWAASAVTPNQMEAFIDQYGLKKYQGQIAPRNAFNAPWFNTLDLHFMQELPSYFEGHKIQLTLDTTNFSNLLFPSWGRLEQVAFPGFVPVTTPKIVNNQYVFTTPLAGPNQVVQTRPSIWQIQIGVHYIF
jgi:hypothetical protein